MTQNLSPKLLHNLEQHYTRVGLMWEEGVPLEDAASDIRVSYEDLEDMHLIMFDQNPKYTINNLFEQEITYQFNANSLQSTEIINETL